MRRLSETQAKCAANLVRRAKETSGLTNGRIAEKAGYNEKVVRDVLHARCPTYDTTKDICEALEIDFDRALAEAGVTDQGGEHAPGYLGGYSKEIYGGLVGRFTTIRPGYADPSLIRSYQTAIDWDDTVSGLRFSEHNRSDASGQTGHIYIPPASAFMYLMTIDKGWIRTILVSQAHNSSSILRGLILSQFNIAGANYAPVCAPIVYIKETPDDGQHSYGELGGDDPHYERYASLLRETLSKGYVKTALPTTKLGGAK
jgi:hypothetical protein